MKTKKLFSQIIIFSLITIISLSCNAQQTHINEYWIEDAPVNQPFVNVIHISQNQDKKIDGELIMIMKSEGANTVTISNIEIDDKNITFAIPEMNLSFTGKFLNDKLYGTFILPDDSEQIFIANKSSIVEFDALQKKFSPPKKTPYSYRYKIPENPNDGWNVGNIINIDLDTSVIFSILRDITNGEYGKVNSFLIIKDNKLVLDEYFLNYKIDDLHLLSSSTKSIASLILGKAYDNNQIDGLNQSIFEFLPNYKNLKTLENTIISIHDLLCMRLGFEPAKSDFPQNVDLFAYVLERNMNNKPGEMFFYDNIAPNLIAPVIKTATNKHIDKFAEDEIFSTLQIQNYNWEEGKQNDFPICQGSLKLRPRDFAKFGYLVLKQGKWNNQQVVSQEWIEKSTQKHSVLNENDGIYYGYLWWIMEIEKNGEKIKVIYSGGSGGQYMFIIPQINMILAFTGENFNNQKEYMLFDIVKEIVLSCE